ncbi:hypothetical protein PIB30_075149 [Stylosanthes scabra]|uniref:Hs1pro-1 C-terminal domain-containing protein n=1 Tax=Stylosanthes scabra TaxID=79078 RepID=A0ABU6YSI1_9FABA|nr:hypothetical protein [Stylosanthes scabra]
MHGRWRLHGDVRAARECCGVGGRKKLQEGGEGVLYSGEDLKASNRDRGLYEVEEADRDSVFRRYGGVLFSSKELVECGEDLEEMKKMVPGILEVEVDPKGGPRMVEAAMRRRRRGGRGGGGDVFIIGSGGQRNDMFVFLEEGRKRKKLMCFVGFPHLFAP